MKPRDESITETSSGIDLCVKGTLVKKSSCLCATPGKQSIGLGIERNSPGQVIGTIGVVTTRANKQRVELDRRINAPIVGIVDPVEVSSTILVEAVSARIAMGANLSQSVIRGEVWGLIIACRGTLRCRDSGDVTRADHIGCIVCVASSKAVPVIIHIDEHVRLRVSANCSVGVISGEVVVQ